MKKYVHWLGTDALTLVVNPPTDTALWWMKLIAYRWKWKILHRFFDKHYIVHERLRKHLLDFGIKNEKIEGLIDPPKYTKKYEKMPHKGFNILYYHPSKACLGGETYIRWKYGIDFIEDAIRYFVNYKDVLFIRVDGNQDLSKIYPITDFMLRPSRHDGLPRMNLECEINDIPYYYKEDGINTSVGITCQILSEINKWKNQDTAETK